MNSILGIWLGEDSLDGAELSQQEVGALNSVSLTSRDVQCVIEKLISAPEKQLYHKLAPTAYRGKLRESLLFMARKSIIPMPPILYSSFPLFLFE